MLRSRFSTHRRAQNALEVIARGVPAAAQVDAPKVPTSRAVLTPSSHDDNAEPEAPASKHVTGRSRQRSSVQGLRTPFKENA